MLEDMRRTGRLRLNPADAQRRARATAPAARLAAFLLAVLVAFSLSSFGIAHAHAGSMGEAHAVSGHADAASAPHGHQGHVQAVPCNDDDSQAGINDCRMSASSCALCVPVPATGLVFGMLGDPAVQVPLSACRSLDPPTLSHPPKLSMTA